MTIMPTIRSGHRIVITMNHFDRTRSMNSRFAITQVSRNGVLPAFGDRSRRTDALDKDLMKRWHDDLEQAKPDLVVDECREQLPRLRAFGEDHLAIGLLAGSRRAAIADELGI